MKMLDLAFLCTTLPPIQLLRMESQVLDSILQQEPSSREVNERCSYDVFLATRLHVNLGIWDITSALFSITQLLTDVCV